MKGSLYQICSAYLSSTPPGCATQCAPSRYLMCDAGSQGQSTEHKETSARPSKRRIQYQAAQTKVIFCPASKGNHDSLHRLSHILRHANMLRLHCSRVMFDACRFPRNCGGFLGLHSRHQIQKVEFHGAG